MKDIHEVKVTVVPDERDFLSPDMLKEQGKSKRLLLSFLYYLISLALRDLFNDQLLFLLQQRQA